MGMANDQCVIADQLGSRDLRNENKFADSRLKHGR